VASAPEADRFLNPRLADLHDPGLLPDVEPAVRRLARAVREGEPILVHGDYDVDGVCATALVVRVLRALKANVQEFVPHRQEHGYDLRPATVRQKAAEGIRLILTLDCGVLAFEAADAAAEAGVDLVVTDHHQPAGDGRLPAALAVVNPKRADSTYPFPDLCGTGVAFKLCSALIQHLGVRSSRFDTAYLDLVALATCADCMPLRDENRVLVAHGLDALRRTNKVGLRALMQAAGLTPQRLNLRAVGFQLAPRINAIGRMDAAAHALSLLLTSDAGEAASLAERIEQANRTRQQEQERMLADALRQVERHLDDRVLVLASPRWHQGIIGIVAARLAETLHRPAILVSVNAEQGVGRGSCRSIAGFNIAVALQACSPHLRRFGGHAAAAGFDIDPDQIETFRSAMQDVALAQLQELSAGPVLEIEAELPLEALSLSLAQEIERLGPFGQDNPAPLLATRNLVVQQQSQLPSKSGPGPDHLRLRLAAAAQGRAITALFWRSAPRADECRQGARIDACYTLEVNTYNNLQSPQLVLTDVRATAG
jgi:single-stranded-DNA-specific exonuclease